MPSVLSVQSWVSSGAVGNAAILPPLHAMGAAVMAVHTAQLSHHPGKGKPGGDILPPAHVGAVLEGLIASGALDACDGVLSGYLGDAANGPPLRRAVARVRRCRPGALWCCDPVLGDGGRIYVRPGLLEFFRDAALPEADLITPNRDELAWLAGSDEADLAALARLASRLAERLRPAGPRAVLVSSAQQAGGRIALILATPSHRWLIETPHLDRAAHGTGDLLAALFLLHALTGETLPEAARLATAGVLAALEATSGPDLASRAAIGARACLDAVGVSALD